MKILRYPRLIHEQLVDLVAQYLIPAETAPAFRQRLRPHKLEKLATSPSRAKLAALRNQHAGQRCFLLGNAPSINELDLSRIDQDFVFLVNRGYLLRSRLAKAAEAIMVANPHAFAEYGQAILDLDWQYLFLSCEIDAEQPIDNALWFAQWDYPRLDEGFFQFDGSRPLYHANTVVLSALQLAIWMGFDPIIIAGVDLDFDPNTPHFYRTQGAELDRSRSVSQDKAMVMQKGFEQAARAIARRCDTRIYNASLESRIECFEKRLWADFFTANQTSDGNNAIQEARSV